MQFDKSTIIEFLQNNGENEKAQQAQQQLPDKVDDQQHAGQLQGLGINPQDLVKQLGADVMKKL